LRSADVPQLRGVADKLAKAHFIGGDFGLRTELGAGLTHGGAIATLQGIGEQEIPGQPGVQKFDLTGREAELIASFLSAFDTGLAPATAFQATVWAGNAATFQFEELAYLREEARRGNCDLVYFRTPQWVEGAFLNLTGTYNPATDKFTTAAAGQPELDATFLIQEAASGQPVTFLGVPLGMGRSQGIDRDMDALLDLDERLAGTDPDLGNTDGDAYPDGYEVQWGMNPLRFDSSSPDTQPPSLVGPVRLIYATTNTLKFEFDTSEYCQVLISYNGGYPVQRIPLAAHKDDQHYVVLNDLVPDTLYNITLSMKDPSGNVFADSTTSLRTAARVLPDPAFVDSIDVSTFVDGGGATWLNADVQLKAGASAVGPGYEVSGLVFHLDVLGALTMIQPDVERLTGPSGVASVQTQLPPPGSLNPGTVIFVVTDVEAPPGSPGYVLARNVESSDGLSY
jgi:hypothetical protein